MYKVLEVYINHFLPSMKCIEKIRYNIFHSSRKYDDAKTAYHRFMEHPDIDKDAKKKMLEFHQTLNPKVLHDQRLLHASLKFRYTPFRYRSTQIIPHCNLENNIFHFAVLMNRHPFWITI